MRITQFEVKGLFGMFDHVVPLNLADRITIIHGPNGFGKTTLLKLLTALFTRRYSELRNVPFEHFTVTFEDGSVVKVDKTGAETEAAQKQLSPDETGEKRKRKPAVIKISLFREGEQTPQSFAPSFSVRGGRQHVPLDVIAEIVDGVKRIGPRKWKFIPTGETLSLADVADRYGDLFPSGSLGVRPEPPWWAELRSSLEIHFIEAQRLLRVRRQTSHKEEARMVAVVMNSEELAKTIQQKIAESAALSQSLDRTFLRRLVKQMGRPRASEQEPTERLRSLEERRSRLRDADLLDKEEDSGFLLPQEMAQIPKEVLAVWIEDMEKKLSSFDKTASRIGLFQRLINKRLRYKRMTISKDFGFRFTAKNEQPLPVEKLSSGEQHELVLLYELLFKVKPDSLILIDEPELSLHVAWQRQFLQDLQEITNLAQFDVVIATHSPQIIHDRWDLTVELQGPPES